jgi:2-keto-4-pentenoate hydratase/2-oxohepta-3-ene-1,7-dioic acid hydratase in catechol pathway
MREVERFIRFARNGSTAYGLVTKDLVNELKGPPFGAIVPTGSSFPLSEVNLLTPCEPSKVLAVGLNYASHRQHVEKEEGVFVTVAGRPAPSDRPVVFAKFPTSLIPHETDIVFPPDATNVHFEGELGLVIGKPAKAVSVADARSHVFGVTICNDLVDREWLLGDLQWFRAKGSDGFGPIGPAIVTGLDYGNLKLETRVNGQVRQSSNTSELVFSPDVLLSYISQYVTLLPGDVIFTGTPGQTQQVKAGDVIEVAIEQVGTLRNRVAG